MAIPSRASRMRRPKSRGSAFWDSSSGRLATSAMSARRAVLEKNGDTIARVADAAAELLELGLEEFVIGAFDDFGDARLERGQAARDRVRDKIDIAHPEFAAFAEIGFLFDRAEKFVDIIDELGGKPHALCITHHREEPFAGPRVIEPLDCRS